MIKGSIVKKKIFFNMYAPTKKVQNVQHDLATEQQQPPHCTSTLFWSVEMSTVMLFMPFPLGSQSKSIVSWLCEPRLRPF